MNPSGLEQTHFCACANLRRATRAVTQLFDETLQPSGLRTTQFTLLVVIATNAPVTVTRLAELLGMDRTTLTRNLAPLEMHGLALTRPGDDKRTRFVEVTPTGETALSRALPLWRQAQERVVTGLGNARFHHLLTELDALVALSS